MNIAIDGNEANVEKRVGIGEYAFQLLKTFSTNYKNHTFTIYIKQKPLSHMPTQTKNWKYKVIGPKFLWTQIALPLRLTNTNYDLIFSPTHYGPRFSPIPSVISIMDLSYIRYPDLFKKSDLLQLTRWTSYSIKKAKQIITISHFSRQEIIEHYNINPAKISVTYPGYKSNIFHNKYRNSQINAFKQKFKLSNYLIFVGTIQPRKNILRLLSAFGQVLKSYPYTKLVIAGKKGWLYEEIFKKMTEFKDKVLYLDYPDDITLANLYSGATGFVLPSLYEGFGITVIEAMACGCPVVISNNSSLIEIGKESAIFIDPFSIESISTGITKLFKISANEKEELVKKGLENVKRYSWETCTKKTIEVFESIV